MNSLLAFTVDGVEVTGVQGQTIISAADEAGIYIPRLCWVKELSPGGSCRVCTVLVNGRPAAACTQPIAEGMVVLNQVEPIIQYRKNLVEMLFVEGNHFCMFCEKSGNCELQATAYRLGILAPKYPYLFPKRDLDASHPDIFIDHNRCILCGRCVRASSQRDGKHVFQFLERGNRKKLGIDAEASLADTSLSVADFAMHVCPVGALMPKRIGFVVPLGQRLYDDRPIGSDIEAKAQTPSEGR